ncbi:hypothetical protein J2T13_004046 [Paenibacillus sp. DS2015]
MMRKMISSLSIASLGLLIFFSGSESLSSLIHGVGWF